jgi:hypothetical protein
MKWGDGRPEHPDRLRAIEVLRCLDLKLNKTEIKIIELVQVSP